MDTHDSEPAQAERSREPSFYLKSAKFFTSLSVFFLAGWILCGLAALVQLVRGFFDHFQWVYIIAWMIGGAICKSVGRNYRATGQQYIRDGIDAGQIAINEQNEAVASGRSSSSSSTSGRAG